METNLIYPIKWEHDIFSSNVDLQRYLKYLFSCSDDYPINNIRELNSYLRRDLETERLSKFGIMKQNEEKYRNFRDLFWEYLKNEKKIHTETHHVGFIITLGNKIVTNTVACAENMEGTLLTKIPYSLLDRIVDEYFDGDEDLFFIKIAKFVNNSGKNLVNFNDINLEERKLIEKRIHGTLSLNDSREILISISHNDEMNTPYHIHRLISI